MQHPAAKLIVMASQMQQQEYGDGTNFVVTLAGELLSHAEGLIRMGLHPNQVIQGYEQACAKALEILPTLKAYEVKDLKDEDEVAMLLKPALTAKLPSYGEFLSKEVAKACIMSLPEAASKFDIDNIRIVQVMGSNIADSYTMRGFLVKRDAETPIKSVQKPVVAVYSCSIDTETADTKGTVLIKTAEEMLNYAKGEEQFAEKAITGLVAAGVSLVVTGGTISNICLHYLEKHKIMAVKIASKFELKRLARAAGANVLSKLQDPRADDLGRLDSSYVLEIGSEKLTIFEKNSENCRLSTVVIRGSTRGLMDDIERAIDDSVSVYRSAIHSPRFLPGAGSTETILASRIEQEGKLLKGLDQYSYIRFGKAFEIIPKVLAENAGLDSNEFIAKFISANLTSPQGLDV